MKFLNFLLVMALVVMVASCAGGEEKAETKTEPTTESKATKPTAPTAAGNQAEIDDNLIQEYIKKNNLEATKHESGLYFVSEKEGTGANPTIANRVTVHYTGTLLDGTKFDSSVDRGQPATFGLGQVVKGWQIGIPMLKEGGKGKLLIPSGLGYGSRAAGQIIKPNSVLVFDVELIKIAG